MKKIGRTCAVIMIFCILVSTKCSAGSLSPLNIDDGEKQQKRIYVVFDNSSSMYHLDTKENIEEEKYIPRWVEADYAVRALAAMMNEEDVLKIFVMVDYKQGSSHAGQKSTNPDSSDVNNLRYAENVLNTMKFTELTYFEAVTAAYNELKEHSEDDCWIVIMTDGAFTSPGNLFSKSVTQEKKEKLEAELCKITDNSNISIAYVPIGNDEGLIKLEEKQDRRIYVPGTAGDSEDFIKGSNDDRIIRDVTDIINKIYRRVQLKKDIERKYIKSGNEGTKFSAPIPMERVIIFMQRAGDVKDFSVGHSEIPTENTKNLPDNMVVLSGNSSIPGPEKDADSNIIPANYNIDKFKYRELQGAIQVFTDVAQGESIDYSNSMDDYDTVDIYYQPAVDVEAEYLQDGRDIEHVKECGVDAGTGYMTDRCVQEGQLDIQLKLVDKRGNAEIGNEEAVSDLLYPGRFEVYLKPWGSEESNKFKLDCKENFFFPCSVQIGAYELTIKTPWNEQKTICLDVQEKRKTIDAVLIGKAEIWIDHQDEEASIAVFQLLQDGKQLISEDVQKIQQLECVSDDEDFRAEFLDISETGQVRFRISLTDPDKDNIAKEASFYVTGIRNYSAGEPEEIRTKEVGLKIRSAEFELSVKSEDEGFEGWGKRIFLDEPVEVQYFCDEQELTGAKKENVSVNIVRVEPERLAPYLEVGRDNNLYLKKGIRLGGPIIDNVNITMEVSYERKAVTETVREEMNFKIRNIPLGIWIFVGIFAVILFVWIFSCVLWRFSKNHIPKYDVKLSSISGRKIRKIYLKRGKHLLLPGYKKVSLVYKTKKSEEVPFVNDFRMKIQRDLLSNGFKLMNYEDFSNSACFCIGDAPINEENNTIRQDICFSVTDKNGNKMKLDFKLK